MALLKVSSKTCFLLQLTLAHKLQAPFCFSKAALVGRDIIVVEKLAALLSQCVSFSFTDVGRVSSAYVRDFKMVERLTALLSQCVSLTDVGILFCCLIQCSFSLVRTCIFHTQVLVGGTEIGWPGLKFMPLLLIGILPGVAPCKAQGTKQIGSKK
eukprot:1160858-Pelagomonas_calceolata.AAC.1